MFFNSAPVMTSATTAPVSTTAEQTTAETVAVPAGAPTAGEAFAMNIGMVAVLVALFYLLLIRPQQKRFKEHANMLNKLSPGTKIVTQGGMVGTIDREISEHELVVDFGNNMKVNIMRSAIMGRYEDALPKPKAANDSSKSAVKEK